MLDSLGDRMKAQYEDRTRFMLPRRTYTIIRLDGKAFHTFTASMVKPFFDELHAALVAAARSLCAEAQGCQFGYVQSDEASFLLTDFAEIGTQAWCDGNIQKICSVDSSIFTEEFSRWRRGARFDARVFTIPDPVEVENYFIWRQKDAERNSINAVAQNLHSHKALQDKDCGAMLAMIEDAGHSWNDYPDWTRHGTVVFKETFDGPQDSIRSRWAHSATPRFLDDRRWLTDRIGRIL